MSLFSLGDIGFSVVQYVAYYVSYLVSVVGYIVFTIETFFLQFVLDLNFDLVNTPSVQLGFSIVLAFANILFVAAVIVMAVATIVRYNTYGAKQILWKIVIAAIGVNFSLILAGTVINFADQATLFLMNSSINQNPNQSSSVSEFKSGGFVDNLAGAFNPQRMMLASTKISTSTAPTTANLSSATGGIYAAVAGIVMTAAMVVLLAIFFGVLVLAFLTRYIMLALLLTIMPVVWLAWIFPFGRGLVSWWRDKFVKFTFFAPMAMFFLYLSMKSVEFLNSAHILGNSGIAALETKEKAGAGITGYIYAALGEFAQPLVSNALNFALVAGTLYGGLYFSSKLGIKAAGMGAKAFESFGNSAKRRASSYARNTGLGAWDKVRTAGKDKDGNSRIQRWGSSINALGQKNKGLGRVTSALGVNAIVRSAGSAVASVGVADKKDLEERAKTYKDRDKNLTGDQVADNFRRNLSRSIHLTDAEERANIELMIDKKKFGKVHEDYDTDELQALMKRAEKGGYADIITKANPMMAQYGSAKSNKREGDAKRNLSKAETIGGAIKGMKAEDLNDMATKSPDTFGWSQDKMLNSDGTMKAPTSSMIHAVLGLGSRINKIEDPEALMRISNTMTWIAEEREAVASGSKERDASMLFKDVKAVKEGADFSDDSEGLGFSDRDVDRFLPVVKQLAKNGNLRTAIEKKFEQAKKARVNAANADPGASGSAAAGSAADAEADDSDGDDQPSNQNGAGNNGRKGGKKKKSSTWNRKSGKKKNRKKK